MKRKPKMSQTLLSVIVPVYNVEQYLPECIESIINQEFRNLEIILINDGSPDRSPQICDSYAKKDRRIKVIHQANQGLSEARNIGIENATGEYVSFVDSDDIISRWMYSAMLKVAKENDLDLVSCGIIDFRDGEKIIDKNERLNYVIIDSREALSHYMYEKYDIHVISCNKIFRKSIFDDIRFQKGMLFEDFIPITQTIIRSGRMASMENKYYYYRKRSDSINGKQFISKDFDKKIMDLSYAVEGAYRIVEAYDKEISKKMMPAIIKAKTSIINKMILSNSIDVSYVSNVQELVKKNKSTILRNKDVRMKDKVKAGALLCFPVYKGIYRLLKNMKH